jgi:polyphosphate kinase 2 (PPK2 family)
VIIIKNTGKKIKKELKIKTNNMPLPKPTPSEKRKDFIQRCMSDSKTAQEFPNSDQRLAVCSTQFKNK